MGLFNKIFKKEDTPDSKIPKGFYTLEVKDVIKLTPGSVKIVFNVPDKLKSEFRFVSGQYLNLSTIIEDSEERRSYSICSGPDEDIAVAVKRVNGGKFSNWANDDLKVGMTIWVAPPMGNFKLENGLKHIVAFAAGSGITPMVSIAKSLQKSGGKLTLFYGNRLQNSIMFHDELAQLGNVSTTHYLTGEALEGYQPGRVDKEAITAAIKSNLSLLKADGFFLCGPEPMIKDAIDVLTLFGVSKTRIHFELYTTPVLLAPETPAEVNHFDGESKVTVILDDERLELTLKAAGKTILDAVNKEGYDAPYSCRGGVCCTCRAKVLEGKATMTLNYSLTDQEVADGFILTCQAHPASEKLVISYDE